MPIYHLPAKPEIVAGLQQGYPVSDRLHAVAVAAGYVIGEGGIQVNRDGSVVIDCDRDPSAQWTAFDPRTMLTPEEVATNQTRAEAATIHTALQKGTATNRQVQTALAFLVKERFDL